MANREHSRKAAHFQSCFIDVLIQTNAKYRTGVQGKLECKGVLGGLTSTAPKTYIDCIPKEAKSTVHGAHHSAHHRACMDAHPVH
eukprot:1082285-Pelagomonas_calceolata.AAC.1